MATTSKSAGSTTKNTALPAAKKAVASKPTPAKKKNGAAGKESPFNSGSPETTKVLAVGLLTNFLYDLLKSGWEFGIANLPDLLSSIPLDRFPMLAQENTGSADEIAAGEYDRWINSVLSVMINLQMQTAEITTMAHEFNMDHREIARLIAERLVDSAGTGRAIVFSELKEYVKAHGFREYLEGTVPPATAEKITRLMKI